MSNAVNIQSQVNKKTKTKQKKGTGSHGEYQTKRLQRLCFVDGQTADAKPEHI